LLHLNPGSGCGKAFVVKLVNPNPWRPLRYKDLLCKKKKEKRKRKRKKSSVNSLLLIVSV
jgi:hypothetical protein